MDQSHMSYIVRNSCYSPSRSRNKQQLLKKNPQIFQALDPTSFESIRWIMSDGLFNNMLLEVSECVSVCVVCLTINKISVLHITNILKIWLVSQAESRISKYSITCIFPPYIFFVCHPRTLIIVDIKT